MHSDAHWCVKGSLPGLCSVVPVRWAEESMRGKRVLYLRRYAVSVVREGPLK